MKKGGAVKRFNQISKDIKSVKIQGAESVAIAGVKAYSLVPTQESARKLLCLRATEPALANALNYAKRTDNCFECVLAHFKESKAKTNELMYKVVRKGMKVFTHCHSSRVVDGLVYAKKKGKKVEVFNTETRPLLQGRKTAEQLSRAGIKVSMSIDSDAREQIKKSDIMMIGADAVLSDGSVVNKVGSEMFAEIAKRDFGKKVYVVTDAWKFSPRNVKIEERNFREIWNEHLKYARVKNPAFEKVDAKYISAIISELGILTPKQFVRKVKKEYGWIK